MITLFSNKKEEYNYFTALEEMAISIIEVTQLLAGKIERNHPNSFEKEWVEAQKIKKLAAEKQREFAHYVYKDFLPPIERGDLLTLAHTLNQVLEETVDLIGRMDRYQIKTVSPEISLYMEIIEKTNQKLPKLMKELERFKHPKRIYPIMEKIYELKNRGDSLYHTTIKTLYSKEKTIIEVIKYSKVYEQFNNLMKCLALLITKVEAIIIQNS